MKCVDELIRLSVKSNTKIETVFDVGAYLGDFSNRILDEKPLAQVFAFEPFKESFHKLEQNLKEYKHAHLHKLALSDAGHKANFSSNVKAYTNSLLATAENVERFTPKNICNTIETVSVDVIRLDAFIEQNKISKIDILKIDTQGNELRVLDGMGKFLNNEFVQLILIEVVFVPLYVGQAYFDQVHNFLNEHGFLLHNLCQVRKSEEAGLLWGDAIYYSSKLKL